jgi:hypothetical protein
LKATAASGIPEHTVEYERSVLAYRAASECGLEGLAEHGKKYIHVFDQDLHLFDVISLARKHIPRISDDAWFSEYLTAKILESFETQENLFEQEGFFRGFGDAPDFDRFLAKVVAKLYARKISCIRDALGSRELPNELTPLIPADGERTGSEDGSRRSIPENQRGLSQAAMGWIAGDHTSSNESTWWRLESKTDTDDESSSVSSVF